MSTQEFVMDEITSLPDASIERFPVELTLLLVLASLIYLGRLSGINLRGEEPRRGLVAMEMLASGNWVVPTQQGLPFYSRPPLQNWIIALFSLPSGNVDLISIRLPSALATILCSLIVYVYARGFLTPSGALVSGLAFLTTGQVMELGRLGETEAMYTLIVSSSMLLWHLGDRRSWSPALNWSTGYSLAALGMLAKGPQAPAYFVVVIWGWLLLKGRWRELPTRSHAFGLVVFLIIWNAWQIPYLLEMGLNSTLRMYGNDIAMRFEDPSHWRTIRHLLEFPFEILACLLPWSTLLPVYASQTFRNALGRRSEPAQFLAFSIAITFPTVWLVPGAHARYFLPLAPSFAVLIGIAIECCWMSRESFWWKNSWIRFTRTIALLVGATAVGFPLLHWYKATGMIVPSEVFPVGMSIVLLPLCLIGWRTAKAETRVERNVSAMTISACLGILFMGLVTNFLQAASNDTEKQIAVLKRQLPQGTKLVSVGLVEHIFPYYFRDPIRPIPHEQLLQPWPVETSYFCFSEINHADQKLPFPWTMIATITCDRTRVRPSRHTVIVGKRIDNFTTVLKAADAG